MAQKKRGLGRGLQALIPEAQAENPSRRPTDVFFPGGSTGDGPESEGSSHSAEIMSALLTPPKRIQSSKRHGTREKTSVSRETQQAQGRRVSGNRAAHGGAGGSDVVDTARKSAQGRTVSRETSTPEVSADGLGEEVSGRDVTTLEGGQAARSFATVPRDAVSNGTDADSLVPVPGATFADLPIDLIQPNPRQPRQVFDEDDIAELAASIEEVGLLQPIVVRRVDGSQGEANHYELIMGERRLRASKEAGLETIPAVVRYTEDEDLLRDALLENLHRVQLNPLEEAAAYQQLLEDFKCTHAELSQKLARSRSQISNTLRLMKLPPLVQRRVAAGVLSAGHARALLGLPDAAAMERLAQRIVAEGLSVRATEEIVALHDEPTENLRAPVMRARSKPLPQLSSRLSDVFDTRVKVTKGSKKGRITIEFAGDEDLARIVTALAPGTQLGEV